MNDAVGAIRAATRGTNFEGRIYLVGGALRDRALGLPPPDDLDFVVEGDAVELAALLFDRGISSHHPVLYPRFGTAKLNIFDIDTEFVTARAESYDSYSRKPRVVAASLRDDAFRRDFTINTLMENLHSGEALDLTGRGMEDLRAGVIRTPKAPEITFHDDPLRMLRAVRFAARFGFRVEPSVWEAILSRANRLQLLGPEPPVVSAERIRDEFSLILLVGAGRQQVNDHTSLGAAAGLQKLRESGLLAQFLPELDATAGVEQNAWHTWDVWTHTLMAMRQLPADATLEVRLALLFHDVGKPRTRTVDDRGVHFYDHQSIGAEMTHAALARLRFNNDVIRSVSEMVALHMRLGEYHSEWSDAAVRRLIRDVHPYTDDLFTIARCDMAATRDDVPHADLAALRVRMDDENRRMNVAEIRSPLDGSEIMKTLGVGPGPVIGRAKEFLVTEVLEARLPEGDRDAASAALCEWFQREGGSGDE